MVYDDEGYDEESGGRGRGPGALLCIVAIGIGFMGADLLTGGALTRALFGAPRVAAGPGPADNEGEEEAGEPGEAGDTEGEPSGD